MAGAATLLAAVIGRGGGVQHDGMASNREVEQQAWCAAAAVLSHPLVWRAAGEEVQRSLRCRDVPRCDTAAAAAAAAVVGPEPREGMRQARLLVAEQLGACLAGWYSAAGAGAAAGTSGGGTGPAMAPAACHLACAVLMAGPGPRNYGHKCSGRNGGHGEVSPNPVTNGSVQADGTAGLGGCISHDESDTLRAALLGSGQDGAAEQLLALMIHWHPGGGGGGSTRQSDCTATYNAEHSRARLVSWWVLREICVWGGSIPGKDGAQHAPLAPSQPPHPTPPRVGDSIPGASPSARLSAFASLHARSHAIFPRAAPGSCGRAEALLVLARSAAACRLPAPPASSAHAWRSTSWFVSLLCHILVPSAAGLGGQLASSVQQLQRQQLGDPISGPSGALLEKARRLIGHASALEQQWPKDDTDGDVKSTRAREMSRHFHSLAIEVISQLGPIGRLEALKSAAEQLALEARFVAAEVAVMAEVDELAAGGEGSGCGGEKGPIQSEAAVLRWRGQMGALSSAVGPLLIALGRAAADGYEAGSCSASEAVLALVPAAHACLATILQVGLPLTRVDANYEPSAVYILPGFSSSDDPSPCSHLPSPNHPQVVEWIPEASPAAASGCTSEQWCTSSSQHVLHKEGVLSPEASSQLLLLLQGLEALVRATCGREPDEEHAPCAETLTWWEEEGGEGHRPRAAAADWNAAGAAGNCSSRVHPHQHVADQVAGRALRELGSLSALALCRYGNPHIFAGVGSVWGV